MTFKTEITKHHDAFQSNRELEKKERELIATHLRSLLQTGAHTDVQFEVNGVSFRAHKGILSARSAVFEAMFNEHTLEQQSSHVLIEDLDPDTFQSLLAYIYTGTIPTGEETFEPLANLLAASGRFALASLKDACEASLGKLLSPETAHSLLVLADLHDAPKLKKAAFNFFKK